MKYYLMLKDWIASEDGQDLAEYALLLVFIAVVVMAVLLPLGEAISAVFGEITAAFE